MLSKEVTLGSREERTIMAQEAVVRAHLVVMVVMVVVMVMVVMMVVMVVMVMMVVSAHQRAAAREEK